MDTSAFNIVPPPGPRINIRVEPAAANLGTIFDANLQIGAIVWTMVNVVLALLMVARIIYVSVNSHNLSHPQGGNTSQCGNLLAKIFKKKQGNVPLWMGFKITTEDVFPFLLATVIAIQGNMFLYAETRGIDGRMEMMPECKKVTKVVWAAIWAVPMLVLVFILECLFRSFAKIGFPPRSGNTLIFCISSTTALTAITCVLRFSTTDNGLCNGHLLLFVNQYGFSGLGLAGVLIPIWTAILIGLWSNLEDSTDVPVEQRIEVIKICAYTILTALQMALIIPYFATATASTVNKTTLFIAEIPLNTMGMLCFIAQHFLDSYAQKLLQSSLTSSDPEKATPRSPQEPFGSAVDEPTSALQEATVDTSREINTHNIIGPTPSQKPFPPHLTTLQIQISQLGQKLVTKAVTIMNPPKEPARSNSPSVPHQSQAQAQAQSFLNHTLTATHTPTTPPPRPLPSPTASPDTHPRKPRPLPPLPPIGLAASTLPPIRPSRSNVPSLYHIEDLAVRAVIMGPAPPRVATRKERSRTLTPILERPVPPPMEKARAPEWYQPKVQGKTERGVA